MKSVLDLDSSEFADDFDGLKFASPQSDQSKDATFNFEIALVTAKAALRPQQAAVVARWPRSSHQLRARANFKKLDGFFVKLFRVNRTRGSKLPRVETTVGLLLRESTKRSKPEGAAVGIKKCDNVFANRPRQSCAKFAARASAWTLESAGAAGVDRGLDVGLQLGRYE